jgi:secreted Zn-dependent insulinase-like peptidase
MKTIKITKNIKKRTYSKPQIERIKLDNEISMVMMSPPGDPDGSIQTEHFSINPFKMPNL